MSDILDPKDTRTVNDIADYVLVRRAVIAARDRSAPSGFMHPRWVAVASAFGLGSTYAIQLCRRFDIDPHEKVARHDEG